jgi:4-hydroxy-tetrahydrodipicolinate synthase
MFSGIIPVLATPFDERGEVDLEDFERIIEFGIAQGAHALAMFGLASEYYKLDDTERRRLQSVLIRTSRGRVPVIISVTHHATEIAVRQAIEAENEGADALMILPPFFLNPTSDAILAHVEEIISSVHVPTLLQYAPAQTGLTAEIVAKLPIDAVKIDAANSVDALLSLSHVRSRLVGYMGLDLPQAVSAGCSGCMPTASLISHFIGIWESLMQDSEAGKRKHVQILPLLSFMMQSVEFLISAEKRLLYLRGIIKNPYCRRPAALLSKSDIEQLKKYD